MFFTFSSILFPAVSGSKKNMKRNAQIVKKAKMRKVKTLPPSASMLDRNTEATAKLLSQFVAVAKDTPVLTR